MYGMQAMHMYAYVRRPSRKWGKDRDNKTKKEETQVIPFLFPPSNQKPKEEKEPQPVLGLGIWRACHRMRKEEEEE